LDKKSPKSTVIKLENIKKTYISGEIYYEALRGISLEINSGELVAIIGPSGSGKSTLMNVIGCLDRFEGGDMWLAGKSVKTMNSDELAYWRGSQIGFVFQSFNLLDKYSVLDNVLLPSLYVEVVDAKKKAIEILNKVGLSDKLNNTPSQLSGGQKQRVAIARALLVDPSIILADEPTGNLDTATGKAIMDIFMELNSEGRTVILITHDNEIAKYAKKVYKIVDGKILSELDN
jgi:putative ABC transport system ATP-binding protein